MANGAVGGLVLVGGSKGGGMQMRGGGFGIERDVPQAICRISFSDDYNVAVFV